MHFTPRPLIGGKTNLPAVEITGWCGRAGEHGDCGHTEITGCPQCQKEQGVQDEDRPLVRMQTIN